MEAKFHVIIGIIFLLKEKHMTFLYVSVFLHLIRILRCRNLRWYTLCFFTCMSISLHEQMYLVFSTSVFRFDICIIFLEINKYLTMSHHLIKWYSLLNLNETARVSRRIQMETSCFICSLILLSSRSVHQFCVSILLVSLSVMEHDDKFVLELYPMKCMNCRIDVSSVDDQRQF